MSKRVRQTPAGAVHLVVYADSGSDQEQIFGARNDFIRATKIVNRLNEWDVDRRAREWVERGHQPRERKYFDQPWFVESVDVR